MNLSEIAEGIIATVNPTSIATIRRSTGAYSTSADGTRTPFYQTIPNVAVQFQALSSDELRQMDGLNIQGNKLAAYLSGQWRGVVRATGEGGDLIVDASGNTWLVATVLENWTDWTKLGLVLQSPGTVIARHGMILDLSIPAESSTVGAMRG